MAANRLQQHAQEITEHITSLKHIALPEGVLHHLSTTVEMLSRHPQHTEQGLQAIEESPGRVLCLSILSTIATYREAIGQSAWQSKEVTEHLEAIFTMLVEALVVLKDFLVLRDVAFLLHDTLLPIPETSTRCLSVLFPVGKRQRTRAEKEHQVLAFESALTALSEQNRSVIEATPEEAWDAYQRIRPRLEPVNMILAEK